MVEAEKKTPDDMAADIVADIKRAESDILDLYERHCRGPVGYQHFYLFGIARRALAQAAAFRSMIEQRNSLVVSSIIRMQLDTVLRLYALFWVADPEKFAEKVFKGTDINKLKAADSEFLTDGYLKKRLAAKNDWIRPVYSETSGYIHFSNRHIKAAFKLSETGAARSVELVIGPEDIGRPLAYYGEMLRAFRHLTMMIPVAAEDWFERLKGGKVSAGILSNSPEIRNLKGKPPK